MALLKQHVQLALAPKPISLKSLQPKAHKQFVRSVGQGVYLVLHCGLVGVAYFEARADVNEE